MAFGNGLHTTYKHGDLGDGLWHGLTHINRLSNIFMVVSQEALQLNRQTHGCGFPKIMFLCGVVSRVIQDHDGGKDMQILGL